MKKMNSCVVDFRLCFAKNVIISCVDYKERNDKYRRNEQQKLKRFSDDASYLYNYHCLFIRILPNTN